MLHTIIIMPAAGLSFSECDTFINIISGAMHTLLHIFDDTLLMFSICKKIKNEWWAWQPDLRNVEWECFPITAL
jgi:hypothetical protein